MCVLASMQKLSCLALLVWVLAGCAWGQTYEVTVGGGLARMSKAPLGSVSADDPIDDDTVLRNGYSYGVRLTYNPYVYYGHEVGYRYTRAGLRTRIPDANGVRTTFEDKVAVHQAFYNFLIYFMPKGERWRPFITGGAQAYNFGKPHHIAGWTGEAGRNYGVNYGAGLKLKLFNHALVRIDLRDYITTKPYNLTPKDPMSFSGWERHQEASVGIGIGF